MEMINRLANSPWRIFLLLLLGVTAGQLHQGVRYVVLDGEESFYLPRIAYAALLGTMFAAMAGVSKNRLAFALTWSILGGFVSVSYALFSPIGGRILLGVFLGFATIAAGPILPMPWACAMRGALGACAAGIIWHYADAAGAPTWLLTALDATVLGIFVAPARAEQLRARLAREIEKVHAVGDSMMRARVESVVDLATKAIEEVDERRERTGEDVTASRAEITELALHVLSLMRRLVTLPPHAIHMAEPISGNIAHDEHRLTTIYCGEVTAVMMPGALELFPATRHTPGVTP